MKMSPMTLDYGNDINPNGPNILASSFKASVLASIPAAQCSVLSAPCLSPSWFLLASPCFVYKKGPDGGDGGKVRAPMLPQPPHVPDVRQGVGAINVYIRFVWGELTDRWMERRGRPSKLLVLAARPHRHIRARRVHPSTVRYVVGVNTCK